MPSLPPHAAAVESSPPVADVSAVPSECLLNFLFYLVRHLFRWNFTQLCLYALPSPTRTTTRDCQTNVKVSVRTASLSDVRAFGHTTYIGHRSCSASVQAADRRAAGCSGQNGSLQGGPGGGGGVRHGQEEAKDQIQHLVSSKKRVLTSKSLSSVQSFKVFECRETRLTEAIDDICERLLQYNVHAERPGSLRYAKVRTRNDPS